MTRWIAFDPETTSLLRSNLAQGARIETLRRGPVDYALARAGAVITVLPAPEDGGTGIAVFRPARHLATPAPGALPSAISARPAAAPPRAPVTPSVPVPLTAPATPPAGVTQPRVSQPASVTPPTATVQPKVSSTGMRAGGFLGLSDEPVFEEEVVEEKKGWWRRLWEE